MNILVINTGSSSLKYQLIDIENESVLAKGLCERIGSENSMITHQWGADNEVAREYEMTDHKAAVEKVISLLVSSDYGVISSMDEISAVGHRVVHGGEKFKESALITDEVMQAIKDCVPLAPLHNPPNIVGIEACMNVMRDKPMVAVFDTAFHSTIPAYAYMYAIPYKYYEKYGIRKYGFHGTSHKYVSKKAAELLGRPLSELKLVVCHLGNGASICAVDGGISIDTSMGFTPLDGLIMGTRSGSLDPAIHDFLAKNENIDIHEINEILNKESGLLGISGVSNDLRDIFAEMDKGNKRAKLAVEMFVYRVKRYIGSYIAIMGGADAVIFTAGIGENNVEIRKMVMQGIEGACVDNDKNKARRVICDVSGEKSSIKTLVIPTNEELEVARETLAVISR